MPGEQLRVARLTKPHGLKGAIKIELHTDDPGRRLAPGSVLSLRPGPGSAWEAGGTVEVGELRYYNEQPVLFLVEVPDRTAAERLVPAELWIDQTEAELSDEPDAWYAYQLIGLAVLRDGKRIGTLTRLDHLPAQDLLAVETEQGEVLVPFVAEIVPEVDLDAGTITVTPPPGLFEEASDESAR